MIPSCHDDTIAWEQGHYHVMSSDDDDNVEFSSWGGGDDDGEEGDHSRNSFETDDINTMDQDEHKHSGPTDPFTYVSLYHDELHSENEENCKQVFEDADSGGSGKMIPGKQYSEQYVQNLRREHQMLENFIRREKDRTISLLRATNESLQCRLRGNNNGGINKVIT